MSDVDQFFRESPFSLTASRETRACWAGRKTVLARLERLKRSLLHRSDSSLDLIWANLGAGKSHALYYLANLLSTSTEAEKFIPVIVEMPDELKKFQDLYARIVADLPMASIAKLILTAQSKDIPEDLHRCARAIVNGSGEERGVALQWLYAQKPNLRELKATTSIQARIEDDSHACEILSGIVSAAAAHGIRVVLLLDEFQRVGTLQPRHRRDSVLSNIRTLFSRTPRFFSLVLAVKSRIEQSAIEMMPEELRTIMGVRPGVALPEMSKEEAMEFITERFRFFRPDRYQGADEAPFGAQTLEATVEHIAGIDGARLIPRTILQALGWIYDGADIDDAGNVSSSEAEVLLKELRWEALD